jgi:mediator of RNA polymerase II transcription subunit 13
MARFTALGASTSHPSPSGRATSLSDDDQSSTESDQDDSSYTSDEPGSPFKSSMRRLAVDDEAASNITSFREPEGVDEADQRLALELPRLTKPEVPEISLSRLFRDSEPLNVELPLSDDDTIQIAQLVAEQAATGSLVLTDAQQSSKETTV